MVFHLFVKTYLFLKPILIKEPFKWLKRDDLAIRGLERGKDYLVGQCSFFFNCNILILVVNGYNCKYLGQQNDFVVMIFQAHNATLVFLHNGSTQAPRDKYVSKGFLNEMLYKLYQLYMIARHDSSRMQS